MNDEQMIWESYMNVLKESRFSDREYNNPDAAWRLTQKEYLAKSNKSNKFHPSDAYQPRRKIEITRENPPVKDSIKIYANDPRGERFRSISWIDSKGENHSWSGLMDYQIGNPDGNTERAYEYILNHASGDIINKKENIQYHFQNNEAYTKDMFPYKIETYNDVEYRYDKKDKILIAFIDSKAVGMASDEWGAYLVQVDPAYRNKGIGSKLAHIYQAINKKDSGGYTESGTSMARSLHKKAVNDALKLKWYDKATTDGSLSKEKTQEILLDVGKGV